MTFTRDIDVSQCVHDIFSHLLRYMGDLVVLQIQRFQRVQIFEHHRWQYFDPGKQKRRLFYDEKERERERKYMIR